MTTTPTVPVAGTKRTQGVAVLNAQVLHAETLFFSSLLAGDTAVLAEVLAEEFTMIDVASGRLVGRDELIGAVEAGEVRFTGIDRNASHTSIRHRRGIAVIIGTTRMTVAVGPTDIAVHSRYTHVYERTPSGWRLLAAQGTPVTRPAPQAEASS